jgi:hypothetical protein
MKGIKITELDVFKANIMDIPTLRDDFAGTVELLNNQLKYFCLMKGRYSCLVKGISA